MDNIVTGHRALIYERYTLGEALRGIGLALAVSMTYLSFVYGALATM